MNCLLYPNVCASFEIPILEMDSSFSIGQRQEEVNVNGKFSAHFAGQSAMTKVAKLLDRGRVLDYGRQFTHWILVTHRPEDDSENSRDDWREKIDVDRFFSPAEFPIPYVMPQDIRFTA
jgi:hypothetical protein